MLKISCYLHKIYQGYVSAKFPPIVKNLSWCLVIAVHMFSCYLHIKIPGEGGIVPCYLHRRYRSIFSKKIPMVKVTMVFLPQLSDVCCVYYHLFTHKLSGIFSHLSSPMVKVTTTFVSKLSGLWCECYRAIYRNYRGAGSTNLFPMIKVANNSFLLCQIYRDVSM